MDLAEAVGATILDRSFNFRDPWGNHLEIVAYRDVQFIKNGEVLPGMGLSLDNCIGPPLEGQPYITSGCFRKEL